MLGSFSLHHYFSWKKSTIKLNTSIQAYLGLCLFTLKPVQLHQNHILIDLCQTAGKTGHHRINNEAAIFFESELSLSADKIEKPNSNLTVILPPLSFFLAEFSYCKAWLKLIFEAWAIGMRSADGIFILQLQLQQNVTVWIGLFRITNQYTVFMVLVPFPFTQGLYSP